MRWTMKAVSIIIPVYNVSKYLRPCLDSVISQTYNELEIILVDDGSTDESGAICDEYAGQDSRFVVIHQQNAGAANAKNTGLDQATGDFVAFIDSDDYVESDWIEKIVNTAENYDADVVEFDFDKVYRNRSEGGNRYPEISVYTPEEYLGQYLDNWTCSLFCNKLFRRELVLDVRFRKERRCIDDEFFTYKAITGAKRIVRIPDVLYHYRQRASSAVSSQKNRLQIADDALEIMIERYNWIRKYFPRLQKVYLSHDVDIMFYFAREFVFTKEVAKKFRKTAKFYLRESIFCSRDRLTLLYAARLQILRISRNRKCDMVHPSSELSDYFP